MLLSTNAVEDLLNDAERELFSIANWWLANGVDMNNGGYVGEVDCNNLPQLEANKGLVLNARILWFFSELALAYPEQRFIDAAKRSYDYIETYFRDPEHGGYWWELEPSGVVVKRRKQVYGQSFVIYAFSSYYSLTQEAAALESSMQLLELLSRHAIDQDYGGFYEAFSEDWSPIEDVRLSEKEQNYPKTMNTHLHVLEAYTALHKVAASKESKSALIYALEIFQRHIVNDSATHLHMFLDEQWNDHSSDYSYGHDIESSWLMWEAVEALADETESANYEPVVIRLAKTVLNEALLPSGAIVDEKHIETGCEATVYPWWVQAEALVGFVNAYELTGDKDYIRATQQVWEFIQANLIDHEGGEWFWFARSPDNQELSNVYKAGAWKGPYHNGRAMLELISRLRKMN